MTATSKALPKLTELEKDVLDGIYRSDYTDGGISPMIWSWSVAPRKTGIKQLPGVVASLVKKGIVTCGGDGTKDNDNTIDVTLLGVQIARELGFFKTDLDGREYYNESHIDDTMERQEYAKATNVKPKAVDKYTRSTGPVILSAKEAHRLLEILVSGKGAEEGIMILAKKGAR